MRLKMLSKLAEISEVLNGLLRHKCMLVVEENLEG
jgi:hypothetical protein